MKKAELKFSSGRFRPENSFVGRSSVYTATWVSVTELIWTVVKRVKEELSVTSSCFLFTLKMDKKRRSEDSQESNTPVKKAPELSGIVFKVMLKEPTTAMKGEYNSMHI